MVPRKKLDIGWMDLLAAAFYCASRGGEAARRGVEAAWVGGDGTRALACLSVRTGFDLLLRALRLPAGSEVVVSAVTIRDMVRILEEHGLVPVPLDVDMDRLAVDAAALERVLTPRSQAVLVAHLFGSRMPLDAIAAVCRRRGLLLIEDCAQAYVGNGFRGHDASDVVMFSFGPIKTNTALGGALLRFRDSRLAAEVRSLEAGLPRQSRLQFLARVLKYAGIKALLVRPVFTGFAVACRMSGRTHDERINAAVRGFGEPDFFLRIRRRPSYPLLALLRRRIVRFREQDIAERIASAESAASWLRGVRRPGAHAAAHSHWVFPIRVSTPEALMDRLWRAGLDATRGASSLCVVGSPADRPELAPRQAEAAMREVLYLPVYPGVPARALSRLARETAAFGGAS